MICCEVLGWQILDIQFLEKKIEEFDLEIDEILDEIEALGIEDKTDINAYIYAVLYLGANKIKEKIIEKVKEFDDLEDFLNNEYRDWESRIREYEENIYTNYLDSGYNSIFEEINYEEIDDMDEEEILNIVASMLNFDIGEYYEFLEGENDE